MLSVVVKLCGTHFTKLMDLGHLDKLTTWKDLVGQIFLSSTSDSVFVKRGVFTGHPLLRRCCVQSEVQRLC